MTVQQLSAIADAPVEIIPCGTARVSKIVAKNRMTLALALKNHLSSKKKKAVSVKKKSEPKASYSKKEHTFRRLIYLGQKGVAPTGKNGSFLRVAIHKITRKVFKVYEKNWTVEGIELYNETYPGDEDYIKNKKNKQEMKRITAYQKEIARREKIEQDFVKNFGVEFGDMKSIISRAETVEADTDVEEDFLGDGLVC
jgi:hypothetical protein